MTIHKWLDFSRDQDQDTDPGISQRILLNCTQGELSGLGGGLQSPTVSVFLLFSMRHFLHAAVYVSKSQ